MKLFFWREKMSKKLGKNNIDSSIDFSLLSDKEQQEFLKKGAKEFSKNFTKTITKLANE
ncbi:MAG: hypothetical protein WDZ73_01845 [Candidatus Paceibacterota bacterium]